MASDKRMYEMLTILKTNRALFGDRLRDQARPQVNDPIWYKFLEQVRGRVICQIRGQVLGPVRFQIIEDIEC